LEINYIEASLEVLADPDEKLVEAEMLLDEEENEVEVSG
jgi:hypothetical protein